VTVKYATANGTAAAGSDYTAASGTLTFAAGQLSKTVHVSVKGDAAVEADETFKVLLSSAGNATISDGTGLGTIRNDDVSLPKMRIADGVIAEGNSGLKALTFAVRLDKASSKAVTVKYATANGTAKAGSDYQSAGGTLTFAAGQVLKTVTVFVIGDKLKEADETFFVNLSSVSGATIADGQGKGTIRNDD
jgi:hypothetical protein